MPLNPSIPLGVQPMQLPMPNPNEGMNALARVMQIRGLQDEQKLNALKFDDAQRTLERKNKLDSLLQQDYATPEDRETALVRNGFVTESGTLAKNRTDAAKAKADADKNSLDMALKKAEHVSSVLSLAKDPQSYATVRAVIKNQFGQDLPEQFDPNVVGALVAQGQTITQKLADLRAQQTQAITMRGQDMTASTARRGQDITVRGQNLTDARAREQFQGVEQQFTPEAIDNAAARYNIDGTLPPMGMGKAGAMGRSAILNRAAELAAGVDPQQQRITQIGNKANSAALSKIQQQQTMVGAFEKNFNKNADIALEYSAKVDRTGIPLANKWINAGKRAVTGDPELAAFDQAIKSASNEYAKIISGSMGNTAVAEGEIKKVESLLNAAQTPEQVSAVLNLMKRETANRMAGFEEEKAQLRSTMTTNKKPEAHAAPSAPAGLPAGWSVKVK